MSDAKSFTEELKVEGKELVDTVKRIIHEGNVRRVVVRNAEGRTVLDIPVNAGVLAHPCRTSPSRKLPSFWTSRTN